MNIILKGLRLRHYAAVFSKSVKTMRLWNFFVRFHLCSQFLHLIMPSLNNNFMPGNGLLTFRNHAAAKIYYTCVCCAHNAPLPTTSGVNRGGINEIASYNFILGQHNTAAPAELNSSRTLHQLLEHAEISCWIFLIICWHLPLEQG